VLHLPDSNGLRCLAHLIRQAGRDVPAVELWSATAGAAPDAESPPGAAELAEAGLEGHGLADEDEILDARARREVRTRLAELEAELAEAERSRDAGRIDVARREVETLRDALSAALGIGGRPRRTRSAGERARVNLTKVIRKAIRHIGEESPELGRHLERAVRTGRLFSYVPGQESGWML
jgi:non-specific serine/threonine protein kinase